MARVNKNPSNLIIEIRDKAENDLFTFAKLVNPSYVYGDIHEKVFNWFSDENAKMNQLALLPRGHLKSHMIAVYCAWIITKKPETTIVYVSATSTLAEAQLLAIKNMIDNEQYRRYWPEMIDKDVGKRARWTTSEIIVDHPKRVIEGVRDSTLTAVGLTTTTTGLHADIIIVDDVVVPGNAYTEDGRNKVTAAMSQFASIKNAGGITKAVGTRYHPKDIYETWKNQKKKVFSETGEFLHEELLWDIFEDVVEKDGVFLWPRKKRPDGKAFGFDFNTLASIEAEYEDRVQFFSQYYQNPNSAGTERINRETFQYYEQSFVKMKSGAWYYRDRKLNVYAAMDFAYTVGKKSDFTCIMVVGVDSERNYYILDIDRFKTDSISEYYNHIFAMHSKWEFRRIRLEVTAAQSVIVKDLKDNYIKPNGLHLSIDENRPIRNKEERIAGILEPKYENGQIWHYKSMFTNLLEDELVMLKPPHDDLKDSLASCIEFAIPPSRSKSNDKIVGNIVYSKRFGGIS